MKRFAKTVVKVLSTYADVLKADFPNHVKDEATVNKLILRLQFQNKVKDCVALNSFIYDPRG